MVKFCINLIKVFVGWVIYCFYSGEYVYMLRLCLGIYRLSLASSCWLQNFWSWGFWWRPRRRNSGGFCNWCFLGFFLYFCFGLLRFYFRCLFGCSISFRRRFNSLFSSLSSLLRSLTSLFHFLLNINICLLNNFHLHHRYFFFHPIIKFAVFFIEIFNDL